MPRFRRLLWIALVLGIVYLFGFVLFLKCATAEASVPFIAKQFDGQSCLLGAIATHMNYKSGKATHIASEIAQVYALKYGRADWYKDGNTSHEAQELVKLWGFTPEYGKLQSVAVLENLIRAGKYPVVFIQNYGAEHAIVTIAVVRNKITYADPLDGQLHEIQDRQLWQMLDGDKWVFYTL